MAEAARAKAHAERAAERVERIERESATRISDADARAGAAESERDLLRMELALHRARADDLRAQLESARAEAAQLRERAVTAELRVPPQPEPGQKPGEVL
ncbi:MAG: hypothetical protein JWQ95_5070 [Sphaerisporangium sp.]|nr:hypothetical protein [Sphaerisporangium sp.]